MSLEHKCVFLLESYPASLRREPEKSVSYETPQNPKSLENLGTQLREVLTDLQAPQEPVNSTSLYASFKGGLEL